MKNIFVCPIIRSFWDFLDFLAVQDISIIHILPASWSSGRLLCSESSGQSERDIRQLSQIWPYFLWGVGKQIKSRWSWMIQNWGTFSWEKMHSFGLCPEYFPIRFWYMSNWNLTWFHLMFGWKKKWCLEKSRCTSQIQWFSKHQAFLVEFCLNSEILKHQFGRRVVFWKK